MNERSDRLTRLLQEPDDGPDQDGKEKWRKLFPLVYEELRDLARRQVGRERKDHTLGATALVHEAYLRLLPHRNVQWKDRRHFFGAAAEAMRRILIDHARRGRREKHGGQRVRVTLGSDRIAVEFDPDRLIALHEALEALMREDARAAEVARLRLFGGLEVLEVAQALDVSERTVLREWSYARAKLALTLGDRDGSAPE